MSNQKSLFESTNHDGRQTFKPVREIEPIAAPIEDKPRLKGQNKAILDLLKNGPVKNTLLAGIALKYTSRISDIRKWLNKNEPGSQIVCKKLGGGVSLYTLINSEETK